VKICHDWLVFARFLSASDVHRLSLLLEKLSACGFRGAALTGSVAGKPIDPKHPRVFRRLAGLGESARVDAAWQDHGRSEQESFTQAAQLAHQLLDRHPELAIPERFTTEVTVCPYFRMMVPSGVPIRPPSSKSLAIGDAS